MLKTRGSLRPDRPASRLRFPRGTWRPARLPRAASDASLEARFLLRSAAAPPPVASAASPSFTPGPLRESVL